MDSFALLAHETLILNINKNKTVHLNEVVFWFSSLHEVYHGHKRLVAINTTAIMHVVIIYLFVKK